MTGRMATLCFAVVAVMTACATPRIDVPRPASEAWPHPEETALGRTVDERLRQSPGRSGFHLLVSGSEAFVARAALAESASRTLDLQYYLIQEDTTGQMLLYRVLQAAQRGVRVRLLIDDLYALGKEFDLATLSVQPNIQVRVFNPFAHRGSLGVSQVLELIRDPSRLNRRMHNKLWIADNSEAIVGGRNLGNEYFDLEGEVNCYDLDVLAAGPVVREVSRSFDEYWNSEWAVPIEAFVPKNPPGPEQLADFERRLQERQESFRDSDYARVLREAGIGRQVRFGNLPLIAASATAIFDEAAKVSAPAAPSSHDPIFARMRKTIEAARQDVIIISPYFIPNDEGIAMLGTQVRRGVRVRILVNSLASTDYIPLAHAVYTRFRARLLAAGVELYEMRPAALEAIRKNHPSVSAGAYLHTKAIVVDGRQVIVGSMNHDPRSRLSNTEVALFMESPEIGAPLDALFDEAVRPDHAFRVVLARARQRDLIWIAEEKGKEVRFDHEPAGFWRRLLAGLLRAFLPEGLL